MGQEKITIIQQLPQLTLKHSHAPSTSFPGLLKDSRAVEPLISLLKLKINFTAVDVLGDVRDPRAIEPLIQAMKKYSKKKVDSRAWKSHLLSKFSKALTKITGQDLGKDPAKWEEWWRKQ